MLYGAGRIREAAESACRSVQTGYAFGQSNTEARAMSELTLDQAIDNIYASLEDNNRDIDEHIAALKGAMATAGAKEAVFDPARLAQNNRQGRKTMQAYFRQRGVKVEFKG
jgi:mevalonate pyrophosphate decarboxylase